MQRPSLVLDVGDEDVLLETCALLGDRLVVELDLTRPLTKP
jgi:hypothetical protein